MSELFTAGLILLWIVVILNFVLTMALIRRVSKLTSRTEYEPAPTLDIGSQAPDFNAETLDDQSVNLSTYARQALAFIFVSPTCRPCMEKIPSFHQIEPHAKRHGIKMVLVSLASKAETQSFVDEHRITLPVLVAPPNNHFAVDYMVTGTPFYCFLDEDGKVRSTGFLDAEWDQLVVKWRQK